MEKIFLSFCFPTLRSSEVISRREKSNPPSLICREEWDVGILHSCAMLLVVFFFSCLFLALVSKRTTFLLLFLFLTQFCVFLWSDGKSFSALAWRIVSALSLSYCTFVLTDWWRRLAVPCVSSPAVPGLFGTNFFHARVSLDGIFILTRRSIRLFIKIWLK